jgi:acyl-CoA oxidase
MGPLSVGRTFISSNSLTNGTSALTIAIKFASIRQQFNKPGSSE